MKKFLYFMFLMITFSIRVDAQTYYSDYSDYEVFDSPIKSSDILDVKELNYYKWYKIDRNIMNYELYNSNEKFLDDCYHTNFTEYSLTKPEIHESRFIENQISYVYTIPKRVRYINLDDLQGSYGAFRITELMVKVDGKEINYDYSCKNCWGDFDKYIHNGIYDENKSYIDNGGSLLIDLKQEYDVDKVELIFYMFDMGTITKTYFIYYLDNNMDKFVEQYFMWFFTLEHAKDSLYVNHNVYNINVPESVWTYKYETLEKISNRYLYYDTIEKYRYNELWCRKYNDVIVYSDLYSKEAIDDFNIKDENSVVNYYEVKKRDKIDIDDNIIIDDQNETIEDHIKSTSDYEILGEIDYKKNGNYSVAVSTEYKIIPVVLEVNIYENTIVEKDEEINSLKEKVEALLNKYNHDIAQLNNRINSLDQENINYKDFIEELLNEKEKIINNYSKSILSLNEEIFNLEEEYQLLKTKNSLLGIENENQQMKIDEINTKNEQITHIKDAYYNKIKEMDNTSNQTNEQIKSVVDNENNLKKYYEDQLENLINEKNKLEKVNNDLNNKNNYSSNENNNLVYKINDYILKISIEKRKKTVILVLIIILLIFLISIKIQKKSSKK